MVETPVVITVASSGIGLALGQAFARDGNALLSVALLEASGAGLHPGHRRHPDALHLLKSASLRA